MNLNYSYVGVSYKLRGKSTGTLTFLTNIVGGIIVSRL